MTAPNPQLREFTEPCPYCGAKPGERCRLQGTSRNAPEAHSARRWASIARHYPGWEQA